MEHTYMRAHVAEACPKTLVQLDWGLIRIFSTFSLEGGLALMEDKVKEQVTGLELRHMFILCCNSALCTHIPNVAIFVYQDMRMEVASRYHEFSADRGIDELSGEDLSGPARDLAE
jgi:hypothetical protein